MRAIAVILALLASACLITACAGKGGQTRTRTVTVKAAATPPSTPPASGAPKSQMTKTRALAFARAVNLRAEDVPGLRASLQGRQRSTAHEQRLSHELQQCVGGGGAGGQPVAEESSPSFQRRASIAQQSVSSEVTVARSSTIATRELNEIRSAHARSCFVHYLNGLFAGAAGQGSSIGPVSVAHGNPPAQGVTGSFGLRISAAIVVRSVRIPFYLDILGFVYGPTEVILQSSGIPVPFPAAAEQHLYTLLLSRARAQHLG